MRKFKRIVSTAKRFCQLKTPRKTWKWKRRVDDSRYLANLAEILDAPQNHHICLGNRHKGKTKLSDMTGVQLAALISTWLKHHRLPETYTIRVGRKRK